MSAKHNLILGIAFAIIAVALIAASASTAPHNESWYRDKFAAYIRGGTEAVLPYGRADVTTAVYAVEIDFLRKFKEGIGQALWYGWCLERAPGLALIAEAGDRDVQPILDRIARQSGITLWLIDDRTGKVTPWNACR